MSQNPNRFPAYPNQTGYPQGGMMPNQMGMNQGMMNAYEKVRMCAYETFWTILLFLLNIFELWKGNTQMNAQMNPNFNQGFNHQMNQVRPAAARNPQMNFNQRPVNKIDTKSF